MSDWLTWSQIVSLYQEPGGTELTLLRRWIDLVPGHSSAPPWKKTFKDKHQQEERCEGSLHNENVIFWEIS